MDELIEILINLIAGFLKNRAVPPTRPGSMPVRPGTPPAAPIPNLQSQARPPTLLKKPAPRRNVRRPAPPMIAVAQPIITPVSKAVVPPVVPIARSIVANTGIPRPNQTPSQTAESIRKWLTPNTLKHQFLLSEILQPPLALREKR